MGTTLKFLSENTVRKCTFGKPVYQSLGVKDLEKCLAKKGITRGVAKHPAWVKLMSGGSGMYGAYMARAGYYEAAYNRATGEKNPRIKYED